MTMKFILTLFVAILPFQSYAQEKPREQNSSPALILYPEVYQIITLERTSDFKLSILERICMEHNLNLLAVEDELGIFIKHSDNKTYKKSKDAILESLSITLNNTATIINSQSYGREYLPSAYLKYIVPSNLNAKHHPNLF